MTKVSVCSATCRNCGTRIYSFWGRFVTCKCFRDTETNKGIALDHTDYYTRGIGEPENFLWEEDQEMPLEEAEKLYESNPKV